MKYQLADKQIYVNKQRLFYDFINEIATRKQEKESANGKIVLHQLARTLCSQHFPN